MHVAFANSQVKNPLYVRIALEFSFHALFSRCYSFSWQLTKKRERERLSRTSILSISSTCFYVSKKKETNEKENARFFFLLFTITTDIIGQTRLQWHSFSI
jgi:hypothetical protein